MKISVWKDKIMTRMVYKNLPFVYFLAFLGLIYIANVHYAERNVRKIQRLTNELKESRWKYLSMKADLMFEGTQSQIAKDVASLGLKSDGEQARLLKVKVHHSKDKMNE
jgi:hypothetical protein